LLLTVEFRLALEPGVLVEATVELLRADDDIPLRRLLARAVPEAGAFYGAGDRQALDHLLNRLSCLAATFLDLAWVIRVIVDHGRVGV
jgi:hypothetical protein